LAAEDEGGSGCSAGTAFGATVAAAAAVVEAAVTGGASGRTAGVARVAAGFITAGAAAAAATAGTAAGVLAALLSVGSLACVGEEAEEEDDDPVDGELGDGESARACRLLIAICRRCSSGLAPTTGFAGVAAAASPGAYTHTPNGWRGGEKLAEEVAAAGVTAAAAAAAAAAPKTGIGMDLRVGVITPFAAGRVATGFFVAAGLFVVATPLELLG
jgi:hypothetical protein